MPLIIYYRNETSARHSQKNLHFSSLDFIHYEFFHIRQKTFISTTLILILCIVLFAKYAQPLTVIIRKDKF